MGVFTEPEYQSGTFPHACEYWCASKNMKIDWFSGNGCHCKYCEEFTDEGTEYEACLRDTHSFYIIKRLFE